MIQSDELFKSVILVVDDEPEIRGQVVYAFRHAGFQSIHEASSGFEGMQAFREHRPHLVISDVRMAGWDGAKLLDEIRAEAGDGPVVILMSAFLTLPAAEAFHRGADLCFAKPFDIRDLVQASIRHLRLRRGL